MLIGHMSCGHMSWLPNYFPGVCFEEINHYVAYHVIKIFEVVEINISMVQTDVKSTQVQTIEIKEKCHLNYLIHITKQHRIEMPPNSSLIAYNRLTC